MTSLREALLEQLLQGAIEEKVDLGSTLSIDGYLTGLGHRMDAVATIGEPDLDEVRRRLQGRATALERAEAVIERVDESGYVPYLLGAAIALALLALWWIAREKTVPAATIGGTAAALAPVAMAWIFAGVALCGALPHDADKARLDDGEADS